MVKTAQSVAHRLKEDESSDESGKPNERNHIGVQDVGVKVSPKNRLLCEINNEEVVNFLVSLLLNICKGSFTIHSSSVQVIEAPCPNGTSSNVEPQISAITFSPNPSGSDSKDNSESYSSRKVPLKSSGSSMMNHEDTLEVILINKETKGLLWKVNTALRE